MAREQVDYKYLAKLSAQAELRLRKAQFAVARSRERLARSRARLEIAQQQLKASEYTLNRFPKGL